MAINGYAQAVKVGYFEKIDFCQRLVRAALHRACGKLLREKSAALLCFGSVKVKAIAMPVLIIAAVFIFRPFAKRCGRSVSGCVSKRILRIVAVS